MARISQRTRYLLLLALIAAPLAVYAQDDLPDLATVTATTDATTAESTNDATTAESTGDATTTGESTAESTGDATTTAESTAQTTDAASTDDQTTTTATFTTGSSASSTVSGLIDAPTIAGAGIPELFIPYTDPAPFMQKSDYPEGTIFIAVGAVLGFLGACVLLWRGLVAWSINRSVKKAALASIRGSEKASAWGGGSSGYNPMAAGKGGLYKDTNGSSMSLDALTSAGKPIKPHFKDHESSAKRESTPPQGLFFSPTAQAGARESVRNSSYLPAGYYAAPNSQAAGGAASTTIGGSLAPYARHSTYNASPPGSPGLPHSGSRNSVAQRASSRDGAQNLRASRDGYGSTRNSYFETASTRQSYLDPSAGTGRENRHSHQSGMYAQHSSSSLAIDRRGRHASRDDLGGSRAPSAYLEDLFDHSTGM